MAAKCIPQGRHIYSARCMRVTMFKPIFPRPMTPMSIVAPSAETPFQHQLVDASRVWYILKQQIGHVPTAIEAFRQCGRYEKLRGKFSKHGVA